MSDENRSESVEMYLKSVSELGGASSPVAVGQVAQRLGVSAPSASEMVKRLVAIGLLQHLPYKGVKLTEEGIQAADDVIRKQRLWECFLVDHLRVDWARAHDLACDLEHATAPEVAEALAAFLGQPERCPHGNPIPGPNRAALASEDVPLSTLNVGDKCIVNAVGPQQSELLSYLAGKGLIPGAKVEVLDSEPLEGPLTLRVGNRTSIVGLGLAELVMVEPHKRLSGQFDDS